MATIESLRRLRLDALFYSHGSLEREPAAVMTRALENARVYGNMILEAARTGDAPEEILRLVGEDFHRRFDRQLAKGDIEILVAGYMVYFKSKGILAWSAPWKVKLLEGAVPVSGATQVTYTGLYPADNWGWLREVTPLSKLEKPARKGGLSSCAIASGWG